MSHIYDLFDHIMETILNKLPRHDRLKCKKVCKQWYNYLMEFPSFRDDRHIYLHDGCRVEDPLMVFSATKRSYENLTIGRVNETHDFGKLARVLGNNGLKNVSFMFTNTRTIHQMLLGFPLIDCLTIRVNEGNYPKFNLILSTRFSFDLVNMKVVNIGIIDARYNDLKNIFDTEVPALRELIPKEAKINVKVDMLHFNRWTSSLTDAIFALNVKFEFSTLKILFNYSSASLLEFMKCNFAFDQLQIPYPDITLKNDIHVLLDQMKNLKEFCVTLENLSELQNFTLETIKKITRLNIDKHSECDWHHEIVLDLSSLVTLHIERIDCKSCLDILFDNTPPKIKKLSMFEPLFIPSWENLESLKLILQTLDAVLLRVSLPSLRNLEINNKSFNGLGITVETFVDVDKYFPQIEKIDITSDEGVRISSSMLDRLKDLFTNRFSNLKVCTLKWVDEKFDFSKKSGIVEMKREKYYYITIY